MSDYNEAPYVRWLKERREERKEREQREKEKRKWYYLDWLDQETIDNFWWVMFFVMWLFVGMIWMSASIEPDHSGPEATSSAEVRNG